MSVPYFRSNRIKEFRRRAKLSQRELARKIGKDHRTVSGYETGRSEIPEDILGKLAGVLGTDSESLMSEGGAVLKDSGGVPDLSWMLRDYGEASLIAKVHGVLMDMDVPLTERCRRARIFFRELERRALSSVVEDDAAALVDEAQEEIDSEHPEHSPIPGAGGPSQKASSPRGGDAPGSKGRPAAPAPAKDGRERES